MDTTEIIIVTILAVAFIVAIFHWLHRATELKDNLFIEPVIMVMLVFFIYLVARG